MRFRKPDIDYISVGITLLVLAATIGTGIAVIDDVGEGLEHNATAFGDYCHERFGENAHIYNSNSVGEHGGLHCQNTATGEVVHFSQVNFETLQEYGNGEASVQDVTATVQPITPWWKVGATPLLIAGVGIVVTVPLLRWLLPDVMKP